MIKVVQDWEIFAKYWKKFTRWSESEGIKNSLLLQGLGDKMSPEDAVRFASALSFWQLHVLDEEDRNEFLSSLNSAVLTGSNTLDIRDE